MAKLIKSSEQFKKILKEAGKEGSVVVVDFFATWCDPCNKVAPIVDSLAREYAGKLRIFKVDIDETETEALAGEYGVETLPTFVVFRNNQRVDTHRGADELELRDFVAKFAN